MCTLAMAATGFQAGGALMGTIGSYNQSKASKASFEYQAAVERNNAVLAQQQSADAIRRGQSAEGNARLRAAQTMGAQRARLAANGVALDEGSALNLLQDTEYMSGVDALTIRDNAAREAWGFQVQGQNATNNAQLLATRAGNERPALSLAAGLLSGAGSVADGWMRRKQATDGRLGTASRNIGSYDGW